MDVERNPTTLSATSSKKQEHLRDDAQQLAENFIRTTAGEPLSTARQVAFVDHHRAAYGVHVLCKAISLAPSTYYAVKKRERAPAKRTVRDRELLPLIKAAWLSEGGKRGARSIWRELQDNGVPVARCTVERLMRAEGMRASRATARRQVHDGAVQRRVTR
ncbi:IS3 family transposase [Actinosynnema pretiosum subsp. pretiosum]|uniref:IS3 family transposase n=1 Tax=Actinosynnema pretiosum subsp. pretiosum TaxID=103721 RepID=A0AA45L650_9PSEU|nr:IS3 family transposase [Actinosynnema mirum]QUF03773.1 IS3 family transposase [Actinosynnema pretiosum subsp. pretiosum]